MKRKMIRRIFFAGIICFSLLNLFQSYQNDTLNSESITLSSLAYASGEEDPEEETVIDDPIRRPLGYIERLELLMEKIGL